MGNRTLAVQLTSRRAPFPFEVEYLWNWFTEFSWGLKADGMGPVMADWLNVNAWCEATDTDAEPWERKALVRLAYTRAMVQGEQMSKKTADGNSPPS